MKLVVIYTVGDGCTYSCDIVVPIEYESAEQLMVDIEDAANHYNSKMQNFRSRYEALSAEYNLFRSPSLAGEFREKFLAITTEERVDGHGAIHSGATVLHVSQMIDAGVFHAPEILTVDEWFARGGQ